MTYICPTRHRERRESERREKASFHLRRAVMCLRMRKRLCCCIDRLYAKNAKDAAPDKTRHSASHVCWYGDTLLLGYSEQDTKDAVCEGEEHLEDQNSTKQKQTRPRWSSLASKAVGPIVHVPRLLACLECHTCCSSVGDSPAEPTLGIVTSRAWRLFQTGLHARYMSTLYRIT
jgi:hypothetical protein